MTDNGVFLKNVLRPGSLQDKSGPSIATEFGLLLPDVLVQHNPECLKQMIEAAQQIDDPANIVAVEDVP